MESVSLVTSVPDLHTARICAAAGVPMISLYDAFSFIDKKVFWITADQMISRPDGMIYTSLYQNPPPTGQDLKLFPYYEGCLCAVWLDYQSDYKSFERLFLS